MSVVWQDQTELLFRELLESVPDAIVVVNEAGEIVLTNSHTEKMFGYSLGELLGQSVETLMPKRFREIHAKHRDGYTANPRLRPMGADLNLISQRKDGREFPTDINLSYLNTENGLLVLSVIRDISKHKQIESALKEAYSALEERVAERTVELSTANERLQQEIIRRRQTEDGMRILAKFPDGNPHPVLRIARDGVILYANRRSQSLLSVWSRQVGQLIPDDWLQIVRDVLNSAASKEMEVKLKDRIFSFVVTPVVDEQYVYLYGQDITERKQIEEQFRQAQKMDAIGRLAGGVAHDFNNLMTVVRGYSELLLSHLDKRDPMRQDIEQINEAGKRASSLAHQLLTFSRKQALQPGTLNLNTLITDLKQMLGRLIGEDIELITVLETGLGYIKADAGQIDQVIMNLTVNARDAMPQGGKLIIETANVDLDEEYAHRHFSLQPGPYVRLSFSDTGTGMDEQTQSRIFEPFYTTKEEGKGTGLGLSTVYGIVKQSGGSIYVYSEPGQGTAFKIYLPRVQQAIESATPDETQLEISCGTETILLVEDENMVRNLAQHILIEYGYTVLEARNGGEALLICEQYQKPIHLMLTDVVMPRMNGPELFKRLKPLLPSLQVLYMSGYTDRSIVHHGVSEQSVVCLEKPFTPKTLTQKVRQVLDVRLR